MIIIHLHSGHEWTVEQFITDMEFAGYQFLRRTALTQTNTWYLSFRQPERVDV